MIFSGKTDIGQRRSSNQDCFSVVTLNSGHILALVCDGMGGANGGNIASSLASSAYNTAVSEKFDTSVSIEGLLKKAVNDANNAVYKKALEDETLKGMGTTLVSALVSDNGEVIAVNVGDSRLYTVSNGCIKQISKDHSYVQYLVDIGKLTQKEAENASMKNIIVRSVGNESETTPDIFKFNIQTGDYILLCSDGLTNCVSDEEIAKTVKASSQEELDNCTDELIRLANLGGGYDNITVVLIKI